MKTEVLDETMKTELLELDDQIREENMAHIRHVGTGEFNEAGEVQAACGKWLRPWKKEWPYTPNFIDQEDEKPSNCADCNAVNGESK